MGKDSRITHLKLGPLQNNVFLVGDKNEVLVIDAADDAEAITKEIGSRRVSAVLITHGHFDHIDAALKLQSLVEGAPIYMHPADQSLWEWQHAGTKPDHTLEDGMEFMTGGVKLQALHTPGHTPGSICYYAPDLGIVFTGDTLFANGPGATRWEYSSRPQILESIHAKLFTLPEETKVMPGHGIFSTIATEKYSPELYR